jgi:hypothetical protein
MNHNWVHCRLLAQARKSNRQEWENKRMEGKEHKMTTFYSPIKPFFLHPYTLKFLTMSFLKMQHAKY